MTAAAAAYFVKGLCGFANTLVFTSILAFGNANISISPVELLLGYPSNVILTWKHRTKLNRQVWIPLSILVLLGSLPGALLLKNADPGYIKAVFGVMVILLGAEMLVKEADLVQLKESKTALFVIGLLSGVLCGLFGMGALLAAYVGRVSETGDEFKANISAVFIVENTFRIVLYSVLGIISMPVVKQALMLVPFMLAGLYAGIRSSRILNERTVRLLVIILLILSGIVMVITNI